MKTIRYNTTDQSYTLHSGQYLTADGKAGRIDPPFAQLEVIETPVPYYDTETEKLLPVTYDIEINEGEHDLTGINGTATEVWAVVDKTAYELAMEGWHHPDYPKRIVAPFSLISDPSMVGIIMKIRFDLDGLPMVREGNIVYVYAKETLQEDQALVDSQEGQIVIENLPT